MIVHCEECEHEWAVAFLPCPAGTFVKLLKSALCPMCASRKVLTGEVPRETQDGDAIGWLTNGDTGTSSETIWHVMMGRTPKRSGWPHDPSDFGRCYRLLKVMPSWRERLSEVAAVYAATPWPRLIAAWGEIEALYLEELKRPDGMARKTYARMKELGA